MPCPKCGTEMEFDSDGWFWVCPNCGWVVDMTGILGE